MAFKSEQQKEYIKLILTDKYFVETEYQDLDINKKFELAQFYTTADACIALIDKFETSEFSGKTILDPACGSGNLLIAMLCAGADSDKIFGNELDLKAVKTCRVRINKAIDRLNEINAYGISDRKHIEDWQIHQGDALIPECLTDFGPEYVYKKKEIS